MALHSSFSFRRSSGRLAFKIVERCHSREENSILIRYDRIKVAYVSLRRDASGKLERMNDETIRLVITPNPELMHLTKHLRIRINSSQFDNKLFMPTSRWPTVPTSR